MAIAERLKELRSAHGLTQTEIADIVGTKQQTWGGYERKKAEPPYRVLSSVTENFDISADWLLLGKGKMHRSAASRGDVEEALETVEARDVGLVEQLPDDFDPQKVAFTPFLDVPMGAGQSGNASIVQVRSHMAFDREWLRREAQVQPDLAFVAQVYGHSMEAKLMDGDLVLCEKTPDVMDGIMAVVHDDELYIKHVIGRRSGLRLVSQNARYSDIEVHQGDHFEVLGRAVRKVVRI